MARISVFLTSATAKQFDVPAKLIEEIFVPAGYILVGYEDEKEATADLVHVGTPFSSLGTIEYIRADNGITAIFTDAPGKKILTALAKRRGFLP